MSKVYVHLADGFEEIEAMAAVDVLRRAEIQVETVSIMEGKGVTGAHGVTVQADILYDETDYEGCDMIILPGGGPGTVKLSQHQGLLNHIKCFLDNDKWVAAICAAPALVLGENGFLKGKSAVCYQGMEEHLKGADVSFDKVAVDGKIITSRGPGTAVDFALELVKVLCGADAADQVAEGMLVTG